MDNFTGIGTGLKEARNKLGLSLSDVSTVTGVSKIMLSQIERGESTPTIAILWKIANGLQVTYTSYIHCINESSWYFIL